MHALQVFCEVAKYQSFSIAAKKLYISQPAVSQLVKKLEETYQVRLLEPVGHGVQLTDLGKTIYKQSQPIFEQEKVVESYLLFQNTVTKIVIGGTQLAIDYLLSKNFIQQTKKDFELKFNIKNTEELIESMQNKQIDFGLIPRKLSIDGYSCKEVYQDR
ncbi:hypothetical protein X291_09035 [Oenococcus oeni IOEB_C23]|uniref:LysR family transcriptional regulator n=1 Tax=Oenococcus oeni TaxID=1247 RepID=UPI00050F223B|nr:LysR family transcriptional regulator [Oenococcus oeni]KGH64588.1 hypothetical protein X291_09035 [Oenococcus oeni IOEB_C23]